MELRATGNAAPAAPHPSPAASTAAAKPAPDSIRVGSPKAAAEPNAAEVTKAVGEINKAMQALSRNIEFSIDADSQRTIVKVIDQETREVIRQLPTAEALEIGKALQKVQGLLIRNTA